MGVVDIVSRTLTSVIVESPVLETVPLIDRVVP
jgi:hypothetical protein